MEVVLKEDVVGLGDIGETVAVKPGYARNFLIPSGLALESNSSNAKQVAHRMKQIVAKKNRLKTECEAAAEKLSGVSVVAELRVGSGGRVFGSVTSREIASKLAELGFEVDRRRVLLGEPIKKIGTRKIKVKLHAEVVTEVSVTVNALEATKEEEDEETKAAKAKLDAAAFDEEEMDFAAEFEEAADEMSESEEGDEPESDQENTEKPE